MTLCTKKVCRHAIKNINTHEVHYEMSCLLYSSNIKLSSPVINNIIIAGSMLMFLVVLLTTLEYGHLLTGAFDRAYCMVSYVLVV